MQEFYINGTVAYKGTNKGGAGEEKGGHTVHYYSGRFIVQLSLYLVNPEKHRSALKVTVKSQRTRRQSSLGTE